MKRKIEKILEDYKNGRITESDAVNAILLLFVSGDVRLCPVCKTTVMINGMCPKCTAELC